MSEFELLLNEFRDVQWLNIESYLDRVKKNVNFVHNDEDAVLDLAARKYFAMLLNFANEFMQVYNKALLDNVYPFKKVTKVEKP